MQERICSDAGDVGADINAGQGTFRERAIPYAGDGAGDSIASAYASRVLDEHGLALVEQDTSHTAIGGIICIHRYCRQAWAFKECSGANLGYGSGDSNNGQVDVRKRITSDGVNVGADSDVGQAQTLIERIAPDGGDTVGNR